MIGNVMSLMCYSMLQVSQMLAIITAFLWYKNKFISKILDKQLKCNKLQLCLISCYGPTCYISRP